MRRPGVVKINGDFLFIVPRCSFHRTLLFFDIAAVFDLVFYLFEAAGRQLWKCYFFKIKETAVTDFGAAQELFGRKRVLQRRRAPGAKLPVHLFTGLIPDLLQTPQLAVDKLLFMPVKCIALFTDQADAVSFFSEPQVGIVLSQQQTVFAARSKNTIGFLHPPRDQIVDHHTDIGFAAF